MNSSSIGVPRASEVNLRATNHICIVRPMGSLCGTYVIDPTMPVTPSLIRSPGYGHRANALKHLNLETKTGSINADITLVDRTTLIPLTHPSGRVVMDVNSLSAGSVTVKVVCLCSLNSYDSFTDTSSYLARFRFQCSASLPSDHLRGFRLNHSSYPAFLPRTHRFLRSIGIHHGFQKPICSNDQRQRGRAHIPMFRRGFFLV